MGSILLPPMEPKDIIEKLTVPNLRKNARIVRHYELAEIARFYAKSLGTAVRSTRSRIEYSVNGAAVEEDIYLTLSYTSTEIGGGNVSILWAPVTSPFSLRTKPQ